MYIYIYIYLRCQYILQFLKHGHLIRQWNTKFQFFSDKLKNIYFVSLSLLTKFNRYLTIIIEQKTIAIKLYLIKICNMSSVRFLMTGSLHFNSQTVFVMLDFEIWIFFKYTTKFFVVFFLYAQNYKSVFNAVGTLWQSTLGRSSPNSFFQSLNLVTLLTLLYYWSSGNSIVFLGLRYDIENSEVLQVAP